MIVGESTSTVGRSLTIQGGDDATSSIVLHSNADNSGSARHGYTVYREDDPSVDIWTVGKFSTEANDFIWYNGGVGSNEKMRLATDGDLTLTGTSGETLSVIGSGGTASIINVISDTQSSLIHLQGNTSGSPSLKDAYMSVSTGGVFRNQVGVDSSDSNSYKIANSGGFNSGTMLRFDGVTGTATFNANASGTGDFEVLAETSGVAFKVDVSAKTTEIAGNPLFTGTDGAITADVGQAQGGSPLTETLNFIQTCASSGDSVTLPTPVKGTMIIVHNGSYVTGANPVSVFPSTSTRIGDTAVNTAITLASGETLIAYALNGSNWMPISGTA